MNILHLFPGFSGSCFGNVTDSRPVRAVGTRQPARLGAYVVRCPCWPGSDRGARALTWADVDLRPRPVYRSVLGQGDTKTARADACSTAQTGIEASGSTASGRAAKRLQAGGMAGPRPGLLSRARPSAGPLAGPRESPSPSAAG